MEQLSNIIGSEFFWGIVVGAVLTMVSTGIALKYQRALAQRNVKTLYRDLVTAISEIHAKFEDSRARTGIIEHEYIDLMEFEFQLYGRTREHAVAMKEDSLRKEVREYFIGIAVHYTRIRSSLRMFSEQNALQIQALTDDIRAQAKENTDYHLRMSHSHCESLRDHVSSKTDRLLKNLA